LSSTPPDAVVAKGFLALVSRSGESVVDAFVRLATGDSRDLVRLDQGPVGWLDSDRQCPGSVATRRLRQSQAATASVCRRGPVSGVGEGGVGGAAGAAWRAGPLLRGAGMAGGELSVLASGAVSAVPASPMAPRTEWVPM
jgi:hypothetical protein